MAKDRTIGFINACGDFVNASISLPNADTSKVEIEHNKFLKPDLNKRQTFTFPSGNRIPLPKFAVNSHEYIASITNLVTGRKKTSLSDSSYYDYSKVTEFMVYTRKRTSPSIKIQDGDTYLIYDHPSDKTKLVVHKLEKKGSLQKPQNEGKKKDNENKDSN
jgi:hypothetical protein